MKIVLEINGKLQDGDLLYYENDVLKTINKVALFKNINEQITELQSQLNELKTDVSNIASILKENI